MEAVGKEEGENVQVGQESDTHVHAQVEGGEEPNPNPADGIELGTQNSTAHSGIEFLSEIGAVVKNSDQTAPEGTEDTMTVGNSSNELFPSTECVKLVSNVDSGAHCDGEVGAKIDSEEIGGEKGEALKDEIGSEVNPSIGLHGSDETDNYAGDEGPSQTEVRMEIEKEEYGDEEEKPPSSKTNPSNGPDIAAETDTGDCEMECDMHPVSEVLKEKLINGVNSEANPSREMHISAEHDNVVSELEPGMPSDIEVITDKHIDAVSNKAKSSIAPDDSMETANLVCEVKPDMSHDSEAATGKQINDLISGANTPSGPHISTETDNVVSKGEPDIPRSSGVATEKLIDTHSEPYISAETDNAVSEAEPDEMPSESEVSKEKLIDELDSKINPSNDPHVNAEIDNVNQVESDMPRNNEVEMETEADDNGEKGEALNGGVTRKTMFSISTDISEKGPKPKFYVGRKAGIKSVVSKPTFLLDPDAAEGDESGTEEEQAAFRKEVEKLYKEKYLEFKAPKFYREELNLLKLWRAVIKLGGYEKVTSCKLWRQVGESFNPPKTCTTVSWTFRIFYEKALLEFERDRLNGGQLPLHVEPTRVENRADSSQTLGSGRALRDAAARAMQGWHSHRHIGNGEAGEAISKEKHLSTMPKSDKQLRSSGLLKRKKSSLVDCVLQGSDMKAIKPRLDTVVFDVGPPADWVKINVKRFHDCFEVYGLVPGLLREEVHVQSDPAGRLIISGQPAQLDNPWGVTPFKKVVSLPSRIDPHQTSAVVTLNGQLFVRVPVEQSDF